MKKPLKIAVFRFIEPLFDNYKCSKLFYFDLLCKVKKGIKLGIKRGEVSLPDNRQRAK